MSEPENNEKLNINADLDDRFPALEGAEENPDIPQASAAEPPDGAAPPAEPSPNLDPVADILGEDAKAGDDASAPKAKADQTAWNWTEQYSKAASARAKEKEKEGGADARGFGEVGDPAHSPEDSKMAAMYIPSEKVKQVHNADLTYTPQDQTRPFPWKPVLLTILLVFLGMIVAASVVKMDTVDSRGQAVRRTTFEIIWLKLGGDKLATDNPDIMAYFATKDRIAEIQAACYEYSKKEGSFPDSVSKLVESGIVPEDSSIDGWGHPFTIIPIAQRVVSGGSDGKPDTTDDIVLDDKGLRIPVVYQDYEVGKQGF